MLGVYPGEWKRLGVFFLIGFFVACGITIGSTAGLSLFVNKYGVKQLPYMFIVTSVATLLVMTAYDHFSKHFSNENFFLVILGLSASLVLGIWLLAGMSFGPVFLIFYPVYSTITTVFFAHLFALVYDYFDTQESKRLLPLIVAGISLGSFVGGMGVRFLLKFTSAENLLMVWFVIIMISALPVAAIKRLKIEPVEKKEIPKKHNKSSLNFVEALSHDFKSVMSLPLVRMLILSTFAINFACDISYFVSTKIFLQAYPDKAAFAAFLGVFTAISSLISLIIQVGMLSRIISRLGIANTNFIFPGFLTAGFISVAAWPALPAACLIYFTRKFLSFSVGEPAERLLFNSLPSQMKGRASSFIKGYVTPVSTACASLMIIAVNALLPGRGGFTITLLSIAGLLISIVVIWLKMRTKKQYANSLVSLMKGMSCDLKEMAEDWEKGNDVEMGSIPVEHYLESPDDALYSMMLEFIETVGTPKYSEKFKEVFPQKSLEMKLDTLKVLAKTDGMAQADFLLRLAREDECPEVRASCIRLLGGLKNDDIYNDIAGFIGDVDEKVQSAAIIEVCKSGDIFNMVDALTRLDRMLADKDSEVFRRGIGILKHIGDRRFIRSLDSLLFTRPEEDRECIISAMCELETGENDRYISYFHKLIENEEGILLGLAIDAVRKISSPASIPVLVNAFGTMNISNKQRAIAALGAAGAPAHESLVNILRNTRHPFNARLLCLEQLQSISKQHAGINLDDDANNEIIHIYILIQLRMKLADEGASAPLLDLVIEELIRGHICVWLHLSALKSRRPLNIIMLAEPLLGDSKPARANAMETLENLLDKASFKLISPVFAQMTDRERLDAAGKALAIESLPVHELYEWVINHCIPWHGACLLYHMDIIPGVEGKEWMAGIACKSLAADDEFLSEAAMIAVSKYGLQNLCGDNISGVANGFTEATAQRDSDKYPGGAAMLSTFEKVLLLKKVATFAALDTEGLKVLSGISREVYYTKGEIIFEEGDTGDEMYIIGKGNVRLYLKNNDRQPLAVLGESAYFGEMAVLDGDPRSACAVAETDCMLMQINRAHFIRLISEYPLITLPIFQVLSRRLRLAQK